MILYMRSLTLALCSVLFLNGEVRAAEFFAAPQPMKATVQKEPINTVDPIFRAFINIGSDKFTFLIPEKFRLGGDSEKGRLQLSSTEVDTVITMSFIGDSPAAPQELSPTPYREWLTTRYAGGKFVREFSRPAAGRTGRVFDVEWRGSTGMARTTRAIYIPTSAGVLEVTITSSAKSFPTAQTLLNSILGSLSASVDGKLEVIHLGNTN